MSGGGATGSSMMLAPLVVGLRAAGRDPAELLAHHGLTEALLADPRVRVDNATLLAAWDEAPVLCADESFGLLAARHYAPGMFHVLDYIVSSAPTLGDALSRVTPRAKLLHDLLRVALRIDGDEATLVQQPGTQMPLPRAQGDFFMAALVLLARRLTGVAGAPLQVTFRHAAPRDLRPVRAMFRCPVLYDAPENTITFPTALLAKTSREADAPLASIVGQHAALLSEHLSGTEPLLVRLEQWLSSQLQAQPTLAEAARSMAMGERTLRRRLDALDTSFQHVLTELRVRAALRLLREPRRLDDIAAGVGLSSGRALSRMLRRATGKTPSELRAEAGRAAAE